MLCSSLHRDLEHRNKNPSGLNEEFASLIVVANKCKHFPGARVNGMHSRNLVTLFLDIVLIDADGVDPDVCVAIVGETLNYCIVKSAPHFEEATACDNGREDRYRVILR